MGGPIGSPIPPASRRQRTPSTATSRGWTRSHGPPRAGTSPGTGEPVFVGKGNPRNAVDGVLLSVVFDACRSISYLLALDATSLEKLGQADLPIATPLSFHGAFFPDL